MRNQGLAAFGRDAANAVAGFPESMPLIAADLSLPAEALHAALERRRAGELFYAMPILDCDRAKSAALTASRLIADGVSYDEAREQLRLLTGREAIRLMDNESAEESAKSVRVLRDFLRAADGVVGRSYAELAEIDLLFNEPNPISERFVVSARVPPRPATGSGGGFVIWLPDEPACMGALAVFALGELHAGITVVCADKGASMPPSSRVRYVDRTELDTIEGIAAVIVASNSNPGEAIGLTAWRVPLAVSSTSGAREYLRGVTQYTPWDFSSIQNAALGAMGGAPPEAIGALPSATALASALELARAPRFENGPLVSVAIPTKNRGAVLPRAVASVLKQTYTNFELIVLNDGGEDVSHLLPPDPRIRYISEPPGGGVDELTMRCLKRANGTYFAAVADDDMFFPDHLARAVYVLERTGGSVARSMTATNVLEPDGRGYRLLGHFIDTPPAVDPTDLLVENLNGLSVWRTRTLVDYASSPTTAGHVGDLEIYLRAMQDLDLVNIRAVTAAIDVRRDGSNVSSSDPNGLDRERLAHDYKVLYAAFPVPGRPHLQARRQARIEHVARRSAAPLPVLLLSDYVAGDYLSLRPGGALAESPPAAQPLTLYNSKREVVATLHAMPATYVVPRRADQIARWRERLKLQEVALEDARAQLALHQAELRSAVQRNADLSGVTRNLRISIRRHRDEIALLSEQLHDARQVARSVEGRLDFVERELHAVLSSSSWRFTRPLREAALRFGIRK